MHGLRNSLEPEYSELPFSSLQIQYDREFMNRINPHLLDLFRNNLALILRAENIGGCDASQYDRPISNLLSISSLPMETLNVPTVHAVLSFCYILLSLLSYPSLGSTFTEVSTCDTSRSLAMVQSESSCQRN